MINKLTMLFAVIMAIFFLGGLATTLTRSMMIGFYDVLPVYIFMGIAIGMMLYEAYIETKERNKLTLKKSKNRYLPYFLLLIQPAFMASNLVVARGGVEYVPPISLAFWRWLFVFLILLPFTYLTIFKNIKHLK